MAATATPSPGNAARSAGHPAASGAAQPSPAVAARAPAVEMTAGLRCAGLARPPARRQLPAPRVRRVSPRVRPATTPSPSERARTRTTAATRPASARAGQPRRPARSPSRRSGGSARPSRSGVRPQGSDPAATAAAIHPAAPAAGRNLAGTAAAAELREQASQRAQASKVIAAGKYGQIAGLGPGGSGSRPRGQHLVRRDHACHRRRRRDRSGGRQQRGGSGGKVTSSRGCKPARRPAVSAATLSAASTDAEAACAGAYQFPAGAENRARDRRRGRSRRARLTRPRQAARESSAERRWRVRRRRRPPLPRR